MPRHPIPAILLARVTAADAVGGPRPLQMLIKDIRLAVEQA
jgi:hypothetical protein